MTEALRIALFADSAPQPLARALKEACAQRGLAADIREWAFTSPLAVQADLAAYQPTHILFWTSAEAEQFPEIEPLLALPYPLITYTMATRDDGAYGHLAATTPASLRARILAWNARLLSLATEHPQLAVVDLDLIQSQLGRATTFDPRLWALAHLALTPQATTLLAERTADLLAAQRGRQRKVLVTDLDNTLWQGIVSEVGPAAIHPEAPAHVAYRAWLRTLAGRGILLAVASHNDREVALSAFDHPAQEMNPADFSAFEADWGPKAEMLHRIAQALNVATNSLVFLDDRAEERTAVRAELPEVAVPELPADPALWMEFLAQQNLFETATLTAEDALRAQSLRENTQRQAAAATLSPAEYIASLQQVLTPEPLGPANLARAAQLTQRCNQFNMRGNRFTEAELAGRKGYVYRLTDRYGDLGTISAVILKGNEIEAWVLSCRALHRDVERLILEHLKAAIPNLCGSYAPTERNTACAEIYTTYGIPEAPHA